MCNFLFSGFIVDIHIGDPDIWYVTLYKDQKYGTKAETLDQFKTVLGNFPDIKFIGVHMAGHPEHLNTLSDTLKDFPNLYIDTASTRWMIRELGKHRDNTRDFFSKHSNRILFGSDLSITSHRRDPRDLFYYETRYWSQRLFWETPYVAPLPFKDNDNPNGTTINGLNLSKAVLRKFYFENATQLFKKKN